MKWVGMWELQWALWVEKKAVSKGNWKGVLAEMSVKT